MQQRVQRIEHEPVVLVVPEQVGLGVGEVKHFSGIRVDTVYGSSRGSLRTDNRG
ncbi:hypothetical protein [Dysgonomonas termitidis]